MKKQLVQKIYPGFKIFLFSVFFFALPFYGQTEPPDSIGHSSIFPSDSSLLEKKEKTSYKEALQKKPKLQQDYRRSKNTLTEYVYTPDKHFKFQIKSKKKEADYTFYVIRMTSQKWLTEADVDETLWWHWIKIIVPNEIKGNTGLLMIDGGSKNSSMPTKPGTELELISKLTHTVVASVSNVPFQPIVYAGDTADSRKEDDLIAFGWRKFLDLGGEAKDAEWLARLPMTKAAVRAMDVVSEISRKQKGIPTVEQFMVTGGSKRGWTTYTTGAADKRVIAIAPIVIDVLNIKENFAHHFHVYGKWADAIQAYQNVGFMDWMGSKEFDQLLRIEDPFSYKNELEEIPKFEVNAASGQYFLPDSWKFYYDSLQGEKHMRFIPNAEHHLRGKAMDAAQSLIVFYKMLVDGKQRPHFDWFVDRDGVTHIQTDPNHPPKELVMWRAINKKHRDFMKETIGDEGYESIMIPSRTDGKYEIKPHDWGEGWLSYFVELRYDEGGPFLYKESTGPVILPDTYEHDEFVPDESLGTRP